MLVLTYKVVNGAESSLEASFIDMEPRTRSGSRQWPSSRQARPVYSRCSQITAVSSSPAKNDDTSTLDATPVAFAPVYSEILGYAGTITVTSGIVELAADEYAWLLGSGGITESQYGVTDTPSAVADSAHSVPI